MLNLLLPVTFQPSLRSTEEEYDLQLDAVASYLNLWCAHSSCAAAIGASGAAFHLLAAAPLDLLPCLPSPPPRTPRREVADRVRAGIAEARRRPGYTAGGSARAISIPLDVDVGGEGRSGEWNVF